MADYVDTRLIMESFDELNSRLEEEICGKLTYISTTILPHLVLDFDLDVEFDMLGNPIHRGSANNANR